MCPGTGRRGVGRTPGHILWRTLESEGVDRERLLKKLVRGDALVAQLVKHLPLARVVILGS